MQYILSILWFLVPLCVGVAVGPAIARQIKSRRRRRGLKQIPALIAGHFQPASVEELTVSSRTFPYRVRADLQRAIDQIFGRDVEVTHFSGVRTESHMPTFDFATLLADNHWPPTTAPPQYEQVDIGEEQPIDCLRVGFWLLTKGTQRYAVLISTLERFQEEPGLQFYVATLPGEGGSQFTRELFKRLEDSVLKAQSYRGKILSLETKRSYFGEASGITVHRLRHVERQQVILPASTLELLERNVVQFVQRRARLRQLGQSTKKGLLFYGPPGTGKTHTIHYLARALPGHTTLLISSEQVGLLTEYMSLARLLQPSLVVIEDADLIARDREAMGSPCEEVLLNRLLNEMDGLKEDADILFVLTTNRPEAIERALASRPGRVDQAIEFPPPDDIGREKLVRLYSQGVAISDELVRDLVRRTEGVSAAFIKELMRRCVQFHLEHADSAQIERRDIDLALDELLHSGGSLNAKLLAAGENSHCTA
jgi:AAA+ superfamily predicted ATPase